MILTLVLTSLVNRLYGHSAYIILGCPGSGKSSSVKQILQRDSIEMESLTYMNTDELVHQLSQSNTGHKEYFENKCVYAELSKNAKYESTQELISKYSMNHYMSRRKLLCVDNQVTAFVKNYMDQPKTSSILIESTGMSFEYVNGLVRRALEVGLNVVIVYVHVSDISVLYQRTRLRAISDARPEDHGRFLSKKYLEYCLVKVPDTVNHLTDLYENDDRFELVKIDNS